MELNEIYDPLEEYVDVFEGRFKEVCQKTFEKLANEASIDVDANRQTCSEINNNEAILGKVKRRIGWWKFFCVCMWIVFAAGIGFSIYGFMDNPLVGIISVILSIIVLLILLISIHPKLKALKKERDNLETTIHNLENLAWKQMSPLNRLYDWDLFTRMMSKTVPKLEFDPFFTTQRLSELKEIYNWDDSFNEERSVIFSHSGKINGNPFVICRTKKMEWGEKEYTGELRIEWTEYERGSDGKIREIRRSEILRASIFRPIPEYFQKTRLIYGNTAAPDLIFTRKQSGYASKQNSLSFKRKRKSLRKKSRNLKDNDFAMMTNEDFEVAFDTSNRNNNHQYALLFTPLAQTSMMNILTDNKIGYGDDFDFDKYGMINIISALHMQEPTMDMNPVQYMKYSFDEAAENFYNINASHFRAIYFAFAPLLAIPMYQQIRTHEDFHNKDVQKKSSFWEHEAFANFWGEDKFKHPDSVTENILKTQVINSTNGESLIKVYAFGYRAEKRLTYVSVKGGDGYMHDVPVYWYEYLPVTGHGRFTLSEDNNQIQEDASQSKRIDHIETILGQRGHTIYRRNISSNL